MASLYHQNSLYKIPQGACKGILHDANRNVQFLVVLHMEVDIQPEIVEMLDKIGDALKVEKANREYLVCHSPTVLSDWQRKYQSEYVLVFAHELSVMNIQAKLQAYQAYTFNHFKLLLANDIMDVYNNQALKAKLWKALQEMFAEWK